MHLLHRKDCPEGRVSSNLSSSGERSCSLCHTGTRLSARDRFLGDSWLLAVPVPPSASVDADSFLMSTLPHAPAVTNVSVVSPAVMVVVVMAASLTTVSVDFRFFILARLAPNRVLLHNSTEEEDEVDEEDEARRAAGRLGASKRTQPREAAVTVPLA